ncbi:MAG TPA: hypothetical protein VJ803_00935 [Gemmatimonadaceae bacterium]|nr:hypothetical protein [Gemmatimonadaceae bacterium]
MAVTDTGGGYALDGATEGDHFVAFAHQELDSLGLTSLWVRRALALPGRVARMMESRHRRRLR